MVHLKTYVPVVNPVTLIELLPGLSMFGVFGPDITVHEPLSAFGFNKGSAVITVFVAAHIT